MGAPIAQEVRRLNERLAAEPPRIAVALQTVGSKGYDEMALVLVTANERQTE
jgi:hypothetical protein